MVSPSIFNEEIIQYSRTFVHCKSKRHGIKPMHPSFPCRELSKDTKQYDLKHPGLVDLITTKQNKLPSFI
jgi:hypothetical protein